MLRIDVHSSRELQATILSIRQADRKIQAEIRQQTKGSILPEWQKSVREHADTRLEQRVLGDTAKVTVSNQNIKLTAAASVKKLSGGASPRDLGKAVEFGADRASTSSYEAKSKKGKRFKVTRRTRAQLRPVNREGYAVYPAAKQMIPRFASLWVQTTVRTFHEALERK